METTLQNRVHFFYINGYAWSELFTVPETLHVYCICYHYLEGQWRISSFFYRVFCEENHVLRRRNNQRSKTKSLLPPQKSISKKKLLWASIPEQVLLLPFHLSAKCQGEVRRGIFWGEDRKVGHVIWWIYRWMEEDVMMLYWQGLCNCLMRGEEFRKELTFITTKELGTSTVQNERNPSSSFLMFSIVNSQSIVRNLSLLVKNKIKSA